MAFARAKEIMNSKSSSESRWSVRINDTVGEWLATGIATELHRKNEAIKNYDENAIMFLPFHGSIYKRLTKIQQNITKAKNGDEIHFRFQPKLRMFSISFVSKIIVSCVFIYGLYSIIKQKAFEGVSSRALICMNFKASIIQL